MLLRALADPQDALSLVAVLRGPLFGISDPRAVRVQAGRRLVQHLLQDAERRTVGARPTTAGAPSRRARWPPCASTTAGRACFPPPPRSTASSSTPATSRWRRRRPAASRPATCCTPSTACARSWRTAAASPTPPTRSRPTARRPNEVESLPLEPGRTDVVRLMNLHKAKGLEADVVFLADPCGGFAPRVDVHIERTGLEGAGLVQGRAEVGGLVRRRSCSASTPTGPRTRPRSCRTCRPRRIGCSTSPPPARASCSSSAGRCHQKGTAAWGVLNNFLAGAKELPVPATVAAITSKPSRLLGRGPGRGRAQPEARRTDAVTPPSWSITSVTAEASHIARMTRTAEPRRPTTRRRSSAPTRPRTAPMPAWRGAR